MKKLTIIIISVFTSNLLNAQYDTIGTSKYKCEIGLINEKNELQGEIYKTGDSSITIKKALYSEQGYNKTEFSLMPIPVTSIDYISIYKEGSKIKGLIIGGIAGVFFGGLLGLNSGSDEPTRGNDVVPLSAEENDCVGALIGFIPGTITGLAATSSKKIIGIHGKNEKFLQRKKELESYSIEK